MTPSPTPVAQWHALVERRDPTGLPALIAADAVFHSPVVHKPQPGRDLVVKYLSAAFRMFTGTNFHYVREVVGESDAVLEFEVDLGDIHVNGIDMFRWNAKGEITDFTVMLRPLKSLGAVQQRMAALLGIAPKADAPKASDATTHQGSCHCGTVTFTVHGPIRGAMRCTCSICSRVGALWHGTNEAGLTIDRGADALGTYQFGTMTAKHYFCRTCGVHPFSHPRLDPRLWVANLRCIPGLDADALPVQVFDGRNWEEAARALLKARGA